jgi:adenine-specific DNA-methyltransferase
LEEEEKDTEVAKVASSPRAYLDRMIEILRQSKTLHLPGNVSLELEAVRPLADREYLHAEATAKNGADKNIAIVFGPEDGAIGSEYAFNAAMEAMQQGFQQLFLFGFAPAETWQAGRVGDAKTPFGSLFACFKKFAVFFDMKKWIRSFA